MRKKPYFDKVYRLHQKKTEFKVFFFKYLLRSAETPEVWKNKSFKILDKSLKLRKNSKIRNFCIVSGRGRGLSKNYFGFSRTAFKHMQGIGFLKGFHKF